MTEEQLTAYADEHSKSIDWKGIDCGDSTQELVEAEIINPENDQKTIYAIIRAEDESYEDAQLQLTCTSRHHDWHNTVADRMAEAIQIYQEETEKLEEGEELPSFAEISTGLITEYNKLIATYNEYNDKSEVTLEGIKDGSITAEDIGI